MMSSDTLSSLWSDPKEKLAAITSRDFEYWHEYVINLLMRDIDEFIPMTLRAFPIVKEHVDSLYNDQAINGPNAVRIIEGKEVAVSKLIPSNEEMFAAINEYLKVYFRVVTEYLLSGHSILQGDKEKIEAIYKATSQVAETPAVTEDMPGAKEVLDVLYRSWQRGIDDWRRFGKINDAIRDVLKGHSGVKFFDFGGEKKSIWTILGYSASKDTSQLQMQGVLRHICAETHLTSDDFEEYCEYCERRNSGVQVKAANERRREDLQHLKDYELLCQIALGNSKL